MSAYLAQPLPFPATSPVAFPPLENEPVFSAAKHLQIEMPEKIYSLADLGFSEAEIATFPTPFGATSVFRILSDEGAAAMLEVACMLEKFTTSNARIDRNVRGGAYQSQF